MFTFLGGEGLEDTNIADAISKFSDILKDKNINLNDYIDESIKTPEENSNTQNEPNNLNIDINTILKFKNIAEKLNSNNNPRSQLLQALKPFLTKEKQSKIDEYIKIANILSILEILNKDIL